MNPETLRWIAVSVAMLAAAAVWSAVIVVAIHVSQIALDNLNMIVELAAISPN
jgi:hypothetical protein